MLAQIRDPFDGAIPGRELLDRRFRPLLSAVAFTARDLPNFGVGGPTGKRERDV
jgi:hypothetical protein